MIKIKKLNSFPFVTKEIKYILYNNREKTIKINIKKYTRNCYALYDGVNEVPVGNKTWDDVRMKNSNSGENIREIYVLNSN